MTAPGSLAPLQPLQAIQDVQWWCVAQGTPWTGEWRAYPGVWLFVAAVAVLVRGLHRRGYRGSAGSAGRRGHPGAAAAAVLLLWGTLDWPVGPLGSGHLAAVHAVQFLSLAMVVPLLLLAGMGTAGLHGLARRPSWGRVLGLLTNPFATSVGFALVVVVTHVPTVVDALMASQLGAFALDVAWLGSGLLFWWPVVLDAPRRPGFTAPLKMPYVFFGTQPHLFIGFWLLTSAFPRYAIYELAPRVTSGLTALLDQQIAGAIMLLGMLPIVLGALSVLFFRWSRSEERTWPVTPAAEPSSAS